MLKFRLPEKSFSLLELVITIAVLSIGMTTVLRAFSFSGRVARFSNEMIQAVFLAQDKLQEFGFEEGRHLLALAPPLQEGKKDIFHWKCELGHSADFDLFYLLNVNIAWSSNHKEQAVRVKTYLKS